MEVIAQIDVSTPTGRKLVRELQNKKSVKLEYPIKKEIEEQKTLSIKEVFTNVEKKLNDHYGTRLKLKY